MKDIVIKTVNEMRYPTTGDYWEEDEATQVRVRDMGNEDYEFLVALHELVEMYLTKKRGIPIADIDNFDIEYEKNRKEGDKSEPGNDPHAPYYKEHRFAENIERQMALELVIDWFVYNDIVDSI